MKKLKLFWWELTRFEYQEGSAMFFNKPHYDRILPNLIHYIKYGYISYTK